MTAPRDYATAAGRWAGIGPYYAMFPTRFADQVVAEYTSHGDVVLDPFAGRGTAVFSAAHQGRYGIGIEVNPVGWIYAKAKLSPAPKETVAARFGEIARRAEEFHAQADLLPEFFRYCYSGRIRWFLVAARAILNWQSDQVDRTAMALLLVYLHGKSGAALSNQMRQTKSMAPDYAVRWWAQRTLAPPDFDPVPFLAKRLEWRYAKGTPDIQDSDVHLGNSELELPLIRDTHRLRSKSAHLLLTSPPYFSLTNYHYDQWLRLWMLGGPPDAKRVPGTQDVRGKFENVTRYRELLHNVFGAAAELMSSDAVIYVRTGCSEVTFDTTHDALHEAFPRYHIRQQERPYHRPTQTSLFGDSETKAGEIDIVMRRA